MVYFGLASQRPLYEIWPGKVRFFCYGHLQTGGGSITPLCAVWGLVLVTQVLVAFGLKPVTAVDVTGFKSDETLKLLKKVVGNLCSFSHVPAAVTLICVFLVSHFDPGILPRKIPSSTIEGAIGATFVQEQSLHDLRSRNRKVCTTCNLVRPSGSGHCSVCDHCVRGMDHHCMVLNTCIGRRNRRMFVLLLYVSLFYATTLFIIGTLSTILQWENMKTALEVVAGSPLLVQSTHAAGFLSLLALSLCCVPGCRRLFRLPFRWRYVPIALDLGFVLVVVGAASPDAGSTILPIMFDIGSLVAIVLLGPFASFNLYLIIRNTTWKQRVKEIKRDKEVALSIMDGTTPNFLVDAQRDTMDSSPSHVGITRGFDEESQRLMQWKVQEPADRKVSTNNAIANIFQFVVQPSVSQVFNPRKPVRSYMETLQIFNPSHFDEDEV